MSYKTVLEEDTGETGEPEDTGEPEEPEDTGEPEPEIHKEIAPKEYAAGIVFYYVNKRNIYFLLGKDMRFKWSDFGGKMEAKDHWNPIFTASRECYEETMGIIYSMEELRHILQTTPKYVIGKSYLQKNYYMFMIELNKLYNFTNDFYNLRSYKHLCTYYLEKIQLKWFTIDEILQNEGDKFRNVFYSTIVNNLDLIKSIALI